MTRPPRKGRPSKAAATAAAARGARRWATALVAALLALVVLAPMILQALGRSGVGQGRGAYALIVNELIAARQWLVVDYDAARPRIALIPSIAEQDEVKRFVRQSYLRRDMETTDLAVWSFDFEGRRVTRLNEGAHDLAGPFESTSGWTGSVLFADDNGRRVQIVSDRGEVLDFSLKAGGPAERILLDSKARRRPALWASGYDFVLGRDVVARARRVGDRVVLRVVGGGGREIRLDKEVLAAQRTPPKLRVWEPGEVLRIGAGAQRREFKLFEASASISEEQGAGRRLRYPGLESLAEGVEAGMKPRDKSRPVSTTLDRDVHAAAQRALNRVAERLRGRNGPAFPAAMTVMDASNGAILGLATYPAGPEHLSARERGLVQPPAILTRNQNFVRMPIGSVAKAPLAAAILSYNPDLAQLRVPPVDASGSFDQVLGYDLGGDFDDHVGGEGDGLIGFNRFLQKSSNKYAAALMVASLAPTAPRDPSQPSAPCSAGGGRLAVGSKLPIVDGDLTAPVPWKVDLVTMFDVDAEGEQSDAPEPFDRTLWGALGARDREGFKVVSPERENLGLNDIRSLDTDFVMTILGGNRSRWTNVKVAQTFARMVLRRPVQAHLVDLPLAATTPAVGDAFFCESAWRPVMDGLRAVGEGGGTAAALASVRPKDGEYRVFAKTGTPALEVHRGRTRPNRLLQAYLDGGCGMTWRRSEGFRLAAAPQAVRGEQLRAALSRSPEACLDERDAGRAIAEEILRLNAAHRRGQPGGMTLAGDRVLSAPLNRSIRSGAGHVIALVIARYPSADVRDDAPVRALSIAVNVQRRQEGERTPALEVATALLEDPTIKAWLAADPPQPRPAVTRRG